MNAEQSLTREQLWRLGADTHTPTKGGKSMCASIRFWTVSYGKICWHSDRYSLHRISFPVLLAPMLDRRPQNRRRGQYGVNNLPVRTRSERTGTLQQDLASAKREQRKQMRFVNQVLSEEVQ